MRGLSLSLSLSLSLWLLLPWVLSAVASPAFAHKRFAKKEGAECKECHHNPEGGGARNLIGQYYQAKGTLPLDRSPQGMALVQSTVDRFMADVFAHPPVIMWSKTPEHPVVGNADMGPMASLSARARRVSLDLRGTMTTPTELKQLLSGELTYEKYVDQLIGSEEFKSFFSVYHRDLIRPRTGDYNTDPSYSLVSELVVDGLRVYTSSRLRTEAGQGKCNAERRQKVSPWWDRKAEHWACADTAKAEKSVSIERAGKTEVLRCDSKAGQESGKCGCGPHMIWCYTPQAKEAVRKSMREESTRLYMEVVNNDLPYSEVLTADWSMLDGGLEVFYAKLADQTLAVVDPDLSKPPRRVLRDARHSGILSTSMYLNFFYNGRRWAQRTFEAFMCHNVWPDYDLLDDTRDAGIPAVPYRDSPHLEPSLTVTESRACAACHLQLDGLARVKDRWDPWGQYYERTARGIDIAQRAVLLGQEVDGLDGFGKALANATVFHDCVVQQVYQHMVGRRFWPQEQALREALRVRFVASGLNFKSLVRDVALSAPYQAVGNIKLMTKERYALATRRATGSRFTVGSREGWEVFYDKVGGMDYRKIESRDIRPGVGHSLVQMKGASAICSDFVAQDIEKKSQKYVLQSDLHRPPTPAEFEGALEALYTRTLSRPLAEVPKAEQLMLRKLFDQQASKNIKDGYVAVCVTVMGSSDFAVY